MCYVIKKKKSSQKRKIKMGSKEVQTTSGITQTPNRRGMNCNVAKVRIVLLNH